MILATGECLPLLKDQCSCSDRIHSEAILFSDNDHLYNWSYKQQRRITWGVVAIAGGRKYISNVHV